MIGDVLNIYGHDDVLEKLSLSFRNGKVPPVYIFCGPESIGKKKAALYFAKLLNCKNTENGKPCGVCISCKKMDTDNSPDIYIMSPVGKTEIINIDMVRETKKEANMKPFESAFRVFIVDDADSLTQEAANSFLKILEEPFLNTVFILVTSRKDMILPTILSRAAVVRFNAMPVETAERVLTEKFSVPEKDAQYLSRISGGRIGAALRYLKTDEIVSKNRAIDKLERLLQKPDILDMKEWEYDDRFELRRELEYFLLYFRDLLVARTAPDGRLLFNTDRLMGIRAASKKYRPEFIENMISRLIKFNFYIDANVNVKALVNALIGDLVYERR